MDFKDEFRRSNRKYKKEKDDTYESRRVKGGIMSYVIKKTTITLTRGDTLKAQITLTDAEGNPYEPAPGDVIRFAAKKNYSDNSILINKKIPIDTMILTLNPSDTKNLAYGDYVYDIQLTRSSGEVDTFITKGTLVLTEEVD